MNDIHESDRPLGESAPADGHRVEIKSEDYKLVGNLVLVANAETSPAVLICHGAAKAPNNPITQLKVMQDFLASQGISSLIVHTRGVGVAKDRSKGSYSSTLLDRVTDFTTALRFLGQHADGRKLGLIAGSMSGEVGALIAAKEGRGLKALVLLEPAAYPPGAENIQLGPEFSAAIRGHRNEILMSPAFTALNSTDIPLMVAMGENDNVIPPKARNGFKQLAESRGANGRYLELPGEKHTLLFKPLPDLYSAMADFLTQFLPKTN